MSLNCAALPWRHRALARVLLLSVSAALALAACSSNSNRGVTTSVGVGDGVTLTTPGDVTEIQQNTTLVVTAIVASDVNNAGVVWSLIGQGTLVSPTATTVTYTAPTNVPGVASAEITATSVTDPTQVSTVTLEVLGTPVISQTPLFPANVNVPYAADIPLSGGAEPVTWAISGTLPAGMTFNGGTLSDTTITGTPSATGTYTFTVQATDANSAVATQTFTLIVNPQASCLLLGHYAFLFSGFRGNGGATHAGSINIDANGNITGVQDYKDGNRTTSDEVITSGTCTNRATNTGVIALNAASGTLTYNFAVTVPDSSGTIHSARLQLINSGADSGSGELALVDSTALTGTIPSGNFAFGLLGVTSDEPNTVHFSSAGRFTSTAGVISGGVIDSNSALGALSNAALAGGVTAPDANGRGSIQLSAGSQTPSLAYYIVNASKMYIIENDAAGARSINPRATGYLTPAVGDVSDGSFDAAAMSAPSIMSLWGAMGVTEPISVMSLGRLSGASAGTGSSAGTLNAVLDSTSLLINTADIVYTAQSYSVAPNGRGTLTLATTGLATRSFVFYLDGVSDGYIMEPGSSAGTGGLLEQQFIPTGGIYSDSLDTGELIGGTQFAQSPGPIDLIPLVTLSYGTFSSTYTTGLFSIDPTSGRGLGSLSESGVGDADAVLYQVSPNKFDLMRFSTPAVDGSMEWFILQ